MASLSAAVPQIPSSPNEDDDDAAADDEDENDVFRAMCVENPKLADLTCGITGTMTKDLGRVPWDQPELGVVNSCSIYGRGAWEEWCNRKENIIVDADGSGGGGEGSAKKMVKCPRGGNPICFDDFKDDPEMRSAIAKLIAANRKKNGADILVGDNNDFVQWNSYGLQPQNTKRQAPLRKFDIADIGNTDLNTSLSKAYRGLDPFREIMRTVLSNWQIPRLVVIGGEGHGKSSLLEQLLMLALLARGKSEEFCTSMAIHCRLRRTPGEAGIIMSVRDSANPDVELDGHTSQIPFANAFEFVEKKMKECVDLFDTNNPNKPVKSGIVTDKILVLEVHHPHVATLDLIDLPGACQEPEQKRLDIETIYRNQVEEDKKNHGLAMYLAVVPANTKPTMSPTLSFLKKNDLLEKSFGVFTMCDKILHNKRDLLNLAAWVTGKWTTGKNKDQECADYVKLGRGWVCTSLKIPDASEATEDDSDEDDGSDEDANQRYYTVHSMERLHLQKKEEHEFFQKNPILKALFEKGHCGVVALVAKIEPAHRDILQCEFKPYTMKKLTEKIQNYDLDLKILGNDSLVNNDEKDIMAQNEVKRRLDKALPDIDKKFREDFLTKTMDELLVLLNNNNDQEWEDVKEKMGCLRNNIENLILIDIVNSFKSHWKNRIEHILTSKIEETASDDAAGRNIGFKSFGIIGNFINSVIPSRYGLYKAVKQSSVPVFQLCAYEGYISRILKECDEALDKFKVKIRDHANTIINHCFDLLQPQMLTLEHNATNTSATVKIGCELFVNTLKSYFILHSPSENELSECYKRVEVGGMNPEQEKECERLKAEMQGLINAREGVINALAIQEDEIVQFNEAEWEEDLVEAPAAAAAVATAATANP